MGTSQWGTFPKWRISSNRSQVLATRDLSKPNLSELCSLSNQIFHQVIERISSQCFYFTFVNPDQVIFLLITLQLYLKKDKIKVQKDLKYRTVTGHFFLIALVNVLFQAQCIQEAQRFSEASVLYYNSPKFGTFL